MRRQGAGMSRCRMSMSAGLLAVLVSHAAPADLIGHDTPQRALIKANPILERIARERPEALGEILDRLRAPEPALRRSLRASGRAEAPDDAQGDILAENPALADYYRDSPEAALDLLRLIREATKEK